MDEISRVRMMRCCPCWDRHIHGDGAFVCPQQGAGCHGVAAVLVPDPQNCRAFTGNAHAG